MAPCPGKSKLNLARASGRIASHLSSHLLKVSASVKATGSSPPTKTKSVDSARCFLEKCVGDDIEAMVCSFSERDDPHGYKVCADVEGRKARDVPVFTVWPAYGVAGDPENILPFLLWITAHDQRTHRQTPAALRVGVASAGFAACGPWT